MSKKKEIYIILTDTGTLFTKIIKWCTKAPLNHASIAFDSSLTEVYSFGRKNVHNPFIGGFVKENFYHSFFSQAECAVYRCKINTHDYLKIHEYIQVMKKNQSCYKYQLLGLVGVLIGKKIQRKNSYFCSEFVASLFEQINLALVNKPSHLVRPGDFQHSSLLTEVYRGSVAGYLRKKASLPSPAELKTIRDFIA